MVNVTSLNSSLSLENPTTQAMLDLLRTREKE